ncbi:hypothetical protein G9373_43430, partial [Rhodococcus sp. A14]|nr:hypothetical protein [Rhodococcus sp. A14]
MTVGSKGQRRSDRALVAAYHEARLGELIECAAAEVDRFRAGDVDAFTVDEALHHYHLLSVAERADDGVTVDDGDADMRRALPAVAGRAFVGMVTASSA